MYDLNQAPEVIVKNTDSKTGPAAGDSLYSTRENMLSATLEDNAPLVSIVLIGFNNLEQHTKTCIECILKYTGDVDYELIMVDNGSSDETLEYFKQVPYARKRIIHITKNLGAFYGSRSGLELAAGAYIVGIANDVYVTQNWLSNLLKCAISDKSIGMVGPVSNNVSNYQSIDLCFNGIADMQEKAAQYNISCPAQWHERIRLISPIVLFKKTCLDMIGTYDYGFLHDFADDDITFRVRRAGYKAVLCRDVFVYHAGHTSGQSFEQYRESLQKGRTVFNNKYYGIDAWNDVNNYELTMTALIDPVQSIEAACTNVLGIDVLCGTPLLEVKNKLRSGDVCNVRLSAFTSDAKYWLDLNTICSGKVAVDRLQYLSEHFNADRFDYIVLGKPVNTYSDPYRLTSDMLSLLKDGGHLLMKLTNTYDARTLLSISGNASALDGAIVANVPFPAFEAYLNTLGYECKKKVSEFHCTDVDTMNTLKKVSEDLNPQSANDIFGKIMINNYVLDISR
ncbi:GT2 family glycosyltransferase [Anaerobacterium chartisolvens]|uniref:GT2 family glycosyltransferase n=1 Tax=Anaerobacterium chartisolvens TaxID=1297424 RepID=A0A369BB31_9FIRM|nr:glycosyltransferase family 2 protein [Anaerobacterium chartisolvens]RCX16884.1 GT2 family glycosyltransferase [Anaerobacterium chartisolvens]